MRTDDSRDAAYISWERCVPRNLREGKLDAFVCQG
jgi:hypothetical protein